MKSRLAGFSLVEVTIAAGLVATVVGAVFAANAMVVRLTLASHDRLIASQLAREGLEVVRIMRDTNFSAAVCPTGAGQCHRAWTEGILSPTERLPLSRPIVKRIDRAGHPFSLTTVSGAQTCADYIVRDTARGGLTEATSPPSLNAGQQLFCRRLFIEPMPGPLTDVALRVRSQVAWLGQGKTALRSLDAATANPACVAPAGEWCVEQVSLLADWRTP